MNQQSYKGTVNDPRVTRDGLFTWLNEKFRKSVCDLKFVQQVRRKWVICICE